MPTWLGDLWHFVTNQQLVICFSHRCKKMFFIQMKKTCFLCFLFWNVFYVKVLHYYLANVELHYIMPSSSRDHCLQKYVETTVDWSDDSESDSDCWTWPTLQTLDLMTWIFVLFLMFFMFFYEEEKICFLMFFLISNIMFLSSVR